MCKLSVYKADNGIGYDQSTTRFSSFMVNRLSSLSEHRVFFFYLCGRSRNRIAEADEGLEWCLNSFTPRWVGQVAAVRRHNPTQWGCGSRNDNRACVSSLSDSATVQRTQTRAPVGAILHGWDRDRDDGKERERRRRWYTTKRLN